MTPDKRFASSVIRKAPSLRSAFGRFVVAALTIFSLLNLAAAPNKVLELDGNASYVELPPNIFNNLTQATVEVWAKWDSFRAYSRIFEFGAGWQSVALFNHAKLSDLRYNVYPRNARTNIALMYTIRAANALRTNEWFHFAAVSGPGGMKLYVNGTLIGEHTNAASFSDIQITQTNLFGRGLARNPDDKDFAGQMDEIRVWDHRRSEAQIRENMRKRLAGTEPGLVALWNFEDGKANDRSWHRYRGKLIGNARIVAADSETDVQLTADEVRVLTQTAAPVSAPIAVALPPETSRNAAAWWIAGALILIALLLGALLLMLRRSGVGKDKLLPSATSHALLAGEAHPPANQELKERALAQLTEFAKESLVQGLYSQRKALLETQMKAQQELAELEARLATAQLPERLGAYEKRIAELEKELETRSGEVRELTNATLLLLRQKLEQEKQTEGKGRRFN